MPLMRRRLRSNPMPLPADIRAFYRSVGPMTDPGRHAVAMRALPATSPRSALPCRAI